MLKKFKKDKISYSASTKKKMAIYSLILGLLGTFLGFLILIIGLMEFLGYEFVPFWIDILRNTELPNIITVFLFPDLEKMYVLLYILSEIFPHNRAFLWVWETPVLVFDIIKPDIIMGIILSIIGMIFLSGINDMLKNKDEGIGHLVVGSILALGFGVIYILIFFAHGAMFLLANEEYLTWNPISDFGPVIWYAFLAIPGFLIAVQIKDVK